DHFKQALAEHLATLSLPEKETLEAEVAAARSAVQSLANVELQDAVVRPIAGTHIETIQQDLLFQQAFSNRALAFQYVKPHKLIALQVNIQPRSDTVPTSESELLQFALPHKWDVPAELSFNPPLGPIHIVSSDPSLQQGLRLEAEP